jgi:PRTRC genetic system protein B
MNSYVSIGGSEALSLKGALLVYQGQRRGFVAWHEVRPAADGGAPYLGEAQALTTEFVRGLAQGLGSRVPPEILPENVLVRTAEVLVWWSPAKHRTMFFTQHDPDLKGLNGRRFPHPPLVWKVSGRDLWVRALAENKRPSAATKLMTAPYWNVAGEEGWTCQGSMRSPEDTAIGAMDLWERAFFQSEFTHASGATRLTTHPGGFLGLWESLAGRRKPFPVDYLTSARETLQEFVGRCGNGR